MTAAQPWTQGDLIKNPATRQFSTYDESTDAFVGTLGNLHFSQIYMIYTAQGNTMRITGDILEEDSMKIKVRGDGQWSPMPCLFTQRVSVTEAMADYYQKATAGDVIKAHNRFATFSTDKRWVGNLTALHPGEGYLFRRMGTGSVEIAFHKPAVTAMRRKVSGEQLAVCEFSNPAAATNMTMIATIEGEEVTGDGLRVFVNDELAAVASPMDSLYFLTIQSDRVGELRFEINGETYVPESGVINYSADSHHGTLKAPIMLRKADEAGVYKILENNHVVIIRNNEKYSITGTKL